MNRAERRHYAKMERRGMAMTPGQIKAQRDGFRDSGNATMPQQQAENLDMAARMALLKVLRGNFNERDLAEVQTFLTFGLAFSFNGRLRNFERVNAIRRGIYAARDFELRYRETGKLALYAAEIAALNSAADGVRELLAILPTINEAHVARQIVLGYDDIKSGRAALHAGTHPGVIELVTAWTLNGGDH